MQAVFRLAGDLEVVISNQVGGVLVEIYEGIDPALFPKDPALEFHDMHQRIECSPRMCGQEGLELSTKEPRVQPRKQTLLSLSKARSRALASAIMGAAAEL